MIDLADSCHLKESISGTRMRSVSSLFQRTVEKMSIYSNRQMCESVCKKESACGECILQDAQNMTEVVWQLGRCRSCKT